VFISSKVILEFLVVRSPDLILAGLAQARDLVLLNREIITEGCCDVTRAITGHAFTETDNLGTILTDEIGEGGFNFGALLGRFHAVIIALNISDSNPFH
jgi:hypothetical protein